MQKLFDEYLKHYIALEYFGNELTDEIQEYLNQIEEILESTLLEKDYLVTKAEVAEIEKGAKLAIAPLLISLGAFLSDQMKEVATKEGNWLKNTIGDYFGSDIIIPANIASLVNYIPYSKHNTLQSFTESLRRNVLNVVQRAVRTSYTFGQSTADALRMVKEQLSPLRSRIKADTQTMGSSFAKSTDRYVFNHNNFKIRYVWVSTLDSSTCLVCADLNGQRFESKTNMPMAPVHERCRCLIIPEKDTEPMEVESYSLWLSKRSDKEQYSILGKSRYNLYKNGYEISDFVNNGKKLTLDEVYTQ